MCCSLSLLPSHRLTPKGYDTGATHLCKSQRWVQVSERGMSWACPGLPDAYCWSHQYVACRRNKGRKQARMENDEHSISQKHTGRLTQGNDTERVTERTHMQSEEKKVVAVLRCSSDSDGLPLSGWVQHHLRADCPIVWFLSAAENRGTNIDYFTHRYTYCDPATLLGWKCLFPASDTWDLSTELSYSIPHIQLQCNFMRQSTQI